jgi:hypothetical protein
LQGHWLVLSRVVWVTIAVLTMGVSLSSIPSEFERLQSPCTDTVSCSWFLRLTAENARELGETGLSVTFFAAYFVALEVAFTVVPLAIGTTIFWRRSEDRMAFLLSLALLTYGFATSITFPYHLLELSLIWKWSAAAVTSIGFAAALLCFYTFPDGRFVPRWSRWLALVSIGVSVPGIFFPYSLLSWWRYPLLSALISAILVGGVVSVQVYRYKRVSDAAQRQQTKWVVLGMVAGMGGYCLLFLLTLVLESGVLASLVGNTAGLLLLLLLPIFIAVAILRYRLYDIDVFINRTLVYGVLTVTLALVYFGGVATTQTIFRALTDQQEQPQIAVVVSTLVIAALFNPLRRRIQAFIDRRFYRRKYDAAKTLEALSARRRDETDLDALCDDLTSVVRETMQPAHVSLWLRPDTPPKGKQPD